MVNLGTAITAVSLLQNVRQSQELEQTRERLESERKQSQGEEGEVPRGPNEAQLQAAQRLDELVSNQRRIQPTQGSTDAYVGTTITLDTGNTAVVTVTPTRGHDLKVAEISFDRRDNHAYKVEVDGVRVSSIHRAEFDAPRTVRNGGTVVAEVTNNSSNQTTFDFETIAWATPASSP